MRLWQHDIFISVCLNSAFANSASLAMFHRWPKSLQGLLLTGQWAAVQDYREPVQQKAQTRLCICNTACGCFDKSSWYELFFFKSASSCLTTCHLLAPNYTPGALHSVKFSSGSPQRIRWEPCSDGDRSCSRHTAHTLGLQLEPGILVCFLFHCLVPTM